MFRLEDLDAFQKEEEELLETPVNTNGLRLNDEELKRGLKHYPPDAEIYAGLGPFFDWEDEEDEDPDDDSEDEEN